MHTQNENAYLYKIVIYTVSKQVKKRGPHGSIKATCAVASIQVSVSR